MNAVAERSPARERGSAAAEARPPRRLEPEDACWAGGHPLQQRLERALLRHLAVLDHHHQVGHPHRREPVRDQHCHSSRDQLGEAEEYFVLRERVESGGARAWDEWIAREPDAFPTVERADGDLAVILYTSGTTGKPKGVALSHANLASNARAAASLYELDRERWNLGVLPLSHSYGLVMLNAGHVLGTKSVLLRWFNPEAVLDAITRFRVQAMAGVPTMYVYLLNYPDAGGFDTSSMRAWGSGAAPLPLEIVEPFEKKFGGRLMEGYGLTEASPVVSAHRLSGVRKLGSVGQPIPGVQVAIMDDDDRPVVLRGAPVGELAQPVDQRIEEAVERVERMISVAQDASGSMTTNERPSSVVPKSERKTTGPGRRAAQPARSRTTRAAASIARRRIQRRRILTRTSAAGRSPNKTSTSCSSVAVTSSGARSYVAKSRINSRMIGTSSTRERMDLSASSNRAPADLRADRSYRLMTSRSGGRSSIALMPAAPPPCGQRAGWLRSGSTDWPCRCRQCRDAARACPRQILSETWLR